MKSIIQTDFSGGLNLFVDRFRLADDEYGKAFNIRIRDGSPAPIKAPLEDNMRFSVDVNGVPHYLEIPGPLQGIYGFGTYALCFARGYAYYKDISATYWTKVTNLTLSITADYIYVQAVPATTITYGVKLNVADVIDGNTFDAGVSVYNSLVINGTTSGIIIQDGVSQPYFMWIGNSGLNVKRLGRYADWTMTNREYVPIGKQMAVLDGILFIVSPDGKQIFRSVSGRYLDFVVNVDVNGNKGGDAYTTSYAVSANIITALLPIKSGLLLVGTFDTSYPIEIDWNTLIFGEPTFNNTRSFHAGFVSQFCYAELLNDYSFIDIDGIRSFNALSALNNEGRDSVFSAKVGKLFDGIVQVSGLCCSAVVNNYAFYACKTTSGDVVLVYDLTTEKWVCLDNYTIGSIKMMAVINEALSPILYAITESSIYKLFSATNALEAHIELKTQVSGNGHVEYKLNNYRPIFDFGTTDVVARASEVANNREGKTLEHTFTFDVASVNYPVNYPIYWNTKPNVDNHRFNFAQHAKIAYKVGVNLSWIGNAKLIQSQLDLDEITRETPFKQQSRTP